MKPFSKPPQRPLRGNRQPTTPDAHRINNRISAREVRLIDGKGEQLGIQPTSEALRIAEEAGLDLVEVDLETAALIDYAQTCYLESDGLFDTQHRHDCGREVGQPAPARRPCA